MIVTVCAAGLGPLATPLKGTLSREVAKIGCGVTVTSAVAVMPPSVAWTEAVPVATPTATPFGARVIAVPDVPQVTRVVAKRRPVLSTPTAIKCRVSPSTITALSGSMYSESRATSGPMAVSVVQANARTAPSARPARRG